MNRRNFLNTLGIAVATLALRIKPDALRELPKVRSRILGLDGRNIGDMRFFTHRRVVFYRYPEDHAPLTGLMTLLKDQTQ